MRTLEMKIAIPEVKGIRCVSAEMKDGYILAKFEIEENETSPISESELECKIDPSIFAGAWLEHLPTTRRQEETLTLYQDVKAKGRLHTFTCKIDPSIFAGAWLEHQPTTRRQEETLTLYQDAKAKGRLHTFTCMTIDASVKDGKLVYQKGLPIKTGFSKNQWAKMLKDYNPSRNSRQMSRTEYVCRNLFLIQRLVESGYEIDEAWKTVCDNSRNIGHYRNSDNPKYDFEPTGSREVCGFCDLGNTWKCLAKDPWEEAVGFWVAGGYYGSSGFYCPVADLNHCKDVDCDLNKVVGMLALD